MMGRFGEKVNKLKLYFNKDINSYVRYASEDDIHSELKSKVGYFPLDYSSTLKGPLFEKFDNKGLPLKFMDGKYIYFHTKIFTFGLAHWNLYLKTNLKEHREAVIKVCNYILESTELEEGNIRYFKEFIFGQGFIGEYSGAMEQGLSAFILSAGYEISSNNEYLNGAIECINALFSSSHGLLCSVDDKLWLDEFPKTGKHVLNGHCDGLIGLFAVYVITGENKYKEHFLKICNDMQYTITLFDRGWWSNYWHWKGKYNYIASMKYHTIHIWQLKYLYKISHLEVFHSYYERFLLNTQKKRFRFMALLLISFYKIRMSKQK